MDRWQNQNLKLTYDFFVNNMDEELKNKCAETYRDFPGDQKGGPLLFKIMMDELLINSDAAGQALVAILKKLRIDQLEGENVNKVVGLVRAAVNRLGNIKNPVTGKNAIPDDLNEILLKVLQTSSVTEFNSIFAHIETGASGLKARGEDGRVLQHVAKHLG